MSRVTSKYQVTIPGNIADSYAIRPGDDIAWVAKGKVIRVIPASKRTAAADRAAQLRAFDQATARLQSRQPHDVLTPESRGWSREDLYARGRAD